jgi:glycosyltransferase involved in cell wall biosynthesis
MEAVLPIETQGKLKLSVIICTHNPRADYLQRTLAALNDQTAPKSDWELLLIDNASADSINIDLSWHPNSRIVREDSLGLTSARLRGIAESQSELLVFVDDDNVLDCEYLNETLKIAFSWPQLGTWGGSILPEFDISPPVHLHPYLKYLALREITRPFWANVWDCTDAEPWGAGLCVRREVALAYSEVCQKTSLTVGGRTGLSLLSGEDVEISYVACSLGLGKAVFPQLKVLHLIPKRRLDEDYLVKLSEGLSTSSMVLYFKWGGILPASPFSPVVFTRLLKQLLCARGMQRRLALAALRARIAARRIIANSCQRPGAHGSCAA